MPIKIHFDVILLVRKWGFLSEIQICQSYYTV